MNKYFRTIIFLLPLFLFISMAQARESEWKFDPVHSRIYFEIKHIYASVRGQFEDFSGNLSIDPETYAVTSAGIEVRVKSINTDNPQRDNHLQSPDFFDADKYPLMTFKSKSVKHLSGDSYQITGDLTIKGVTKTVTVPFIFLGAGDNPMDPKQTVAGYEGKFDLNRLTYNVGSGKFFDMGVVGRDVHVTLTFEMLKNKE